MIEVIATISIFINVALITFYFWSGRIIKRQELNKIDLQYSTTCENCKLDFDFGDLDIEIYKENEKQQFITKCPRCGYYNNVTG